MPASAGIEGVALANAVKSELILAAEPRAAGWARRHACATLRGWHLDEENVRTVELLVSELVTNAVITCEGSPGAGSRDQGCIVLTLRWLPQHVMVEVADPDPRPPILANAGPECEGGRGLALVDALSSSWSYAPWPPGGKTVFCLVEFVPSPLWLGRVKRPADSTPADSTRKGRRSDVHP